MIEKPDIERMIKTYEAASKEGQRIREERLSQQEVIEEIEAEERGRRQ